MYQGDPVAARRRRHRGARATTPRVLIRVQYEQLPHLASVEQAMAADAPDVFPGGNTREGQTEETGDLDAGFAKAAHVVERPIPRMSSRTCASKRTAACASGTATS